MSEMDLFAPLTSLQWVNRELLRANGYNPNKVSEDNLKLLTHPDQWLDTAHCDAAGLHNY